MLQRWDSGLHFLILFLSYLAGLAATYERGFAWEMMLTIELLVLRKKRKWKWKWKWEWNGNRNAG